MTMELAAIEAEVLRLFDSFRYSATDGQIDAYITAVSAYSPWAVSKAVDRLVSGGVDRQHQFAPTAAELAQQARLFDGIKPDDDDGAPAERLVSYPIGGEPPPGFVPLGPIEVAFEGRRIDMRGLDHATKEFVLEHHRLPEPGEMGKPAEQIEFTPKFQRA